MMGDHSLALWVMWNKEYFRQTFFRGGVLVTVLSLLEKGVHTPQASESLGYKCRSLGSLGFWSWPVVGLRNLYLYLETQVRQGGVRALQTLKE